MCAAVMMRTVWGLLLVAMLTIGCSQRDDDGAETADAFVAPVEAPVETPATTAEAEPVTAAPPATAPLKDEAPTYPIHVPAEHALHATFQRHVTLRATTTVTLPNGRTDVPLDHEFHFVGDVSVTAVEDGHQAAERIVVRKCLLQRRGSVPGQSGILMEAGTVLDFSRDDGKLTLLVDGQPRDPYTLYDGVLEMVCGATDPRNPVDVEWLTPERQMAVGESWALDTEQVTMILRDSMHGLTAKSIAGEVKLAAMDLPPEPALPSQILTASMYLDGLTGTVENDDDAGMTVTVTGGNLDMDMQWIYPYPEAIILPQIMEIQTVVKMNGRVQAQGRSMNVRLTTEMDASISEMTLD